MLGEDVDSDVTAEATHRLCCLSETSLVLWVGGVVGGVREGDLERVDEAFGRGPIASEANAARRRTQLSGLPVV